jgi:hypothetical protein
MQIYVHQNGQQLGPLSEADIQARLAAGTISRDDLVWWEGQPGWVALGQSPLAPGPAQIPPPAPVSPADIAMMPGSTPLDNRGAGRTSGLAVGSLISGIASFFVGISFILAIILGHLALSQIRKNPGMQGRGMAMAGLIMGYLYPAVAVVALVVLFALGQQARGTFHTINAQAEPAQTNSAPGTNSAPANGQ